MQNRFTSKGISKGYIIEFPKKLKAVFIPQPNYIKMSILSYIADLLIFSDEMNIYF